jgi:hypothetical protein
MMCAIDMGMTNKEIDKMKRSKNQKGSVDKQKRKGQAYSAGGGDSRYARKRQWCIKNGVWGWEVPEPKPWK